MEASGYPNRSSLDDSTILSGSLWKDFHVFLAAAKARSFAGAAAILDMNPHTVSRHVRRLQIELGAQLFISTKHGIKLTSKGQALGHALSQVDHTLYALSTDLRAETEDAEGLVRISVTDGLNTFFVAPAIQGFLAKYPKIQLQIKSATNVFNLRETQTDMMISPEMRNASDLSVCPLGSLHLIPVVSRSYIQRYGVPTKENLAAHTFLQFDFYTPKADLWKPWTDLMARGQPGPSCDSSMAYGMLVKAGLGIGLLGSYTTLEQDAVPLDLGVRISVPMYATALSERLSSHPVRLVFDWLCDIFSRDNPWFDPEFQLNPAPSRFDMGIKMLFNLAQQEGDIE